MADVLASPLLVVGPGRAGRALARSWRRAGGRLVGLVGRTAQAASGAARELATDALDLSTAPPRVELLAVAVPDDLVASVAAGAAERVRARLAFHLSGALPAAALAPFAARGSALASLHPLRAFTGAPEDDWTGAFVAVEGDEPAIAEAEAIARALGATPYRIAPGSKSLYHAAAALAAGGTMALLSVAVRAAAAAGLPEAQARAALADLAAGAAAATARRPAGEVLTGPVARRDAATVRAHAAALAARPEALELYRRLAREILEATPGRGREHEILSALDETKPPHAPAEGSARR